MSGAGFAGDRWDRVAELFHTAVDLAADQREAFLRQTCGSDDQLRAEVESLLANDFQESHLEGIVDEAAAGLLAEDDA